jgi:hypothetical protein
MAGGVLQHVGREKAPDCFAGPADRRARAVCCLLRVILGTPNDPRLPAGAVDAVLIANTYHEPRLVIVDRTARDPTVRDAGHHEVQLAVVDDEARRHGFETLARDEGFIDRPNHDIWWMIVARKP